MREIGTGARKAVALVVAAALGLLLAQAHHAAARPAVSAKATGAGATLMTQRSPAASTPATSSARVRDKPDVTRATYSLTRVHAVVARSMSSA